MRGPLPAYDEIWRRYPRGPLFDDSLMAAACWLREKAASFRGRRAAGAPTSDLHQVDPLGHYNKLLLDEGAIPLGESTCRT